jgi:hypothetical protein
VNTFDDKPNRIPARIKRPGDRWRLVELLGMVFTGILIFKIFYATAVVDHPAASNAGGNSKTARVSIEIEFGPEGKPLKNTILWRDGMTVRDLLTSASLGFKSFGEKGRGSSALLVAINETRNEGAGGRNWMYYVNGQFADRSYAIYELKPGDHVLWTFGRQQ